MFKRVSLGWYRTRDKDWLIAQRDNIITFLNLCGIDLSLISVDNPSVFERRNYYIIFHDTNWRKDEENKEVIRLLNKHFLNKEK